MKILNYIGIAALAVTAFACSPDDHEPIDTANIPVMSDLTITITEEADNFVSFSVEDEEVVPVWIFGDDDFVVGNDYKRKYAFAGDYTVQVKAYNHNGYSTDSVVEQFSLAQSDLSEPFYYLAGDDLAGKDWVFDTASGEYWCMANPDNSSEIWWNPIAAGVYPEADLAGKMRFDVVNQGTLTHWNDSTGVADATSSYTFNADYTQLTIVGDANILGSGVSTNGEDQALNNGVFEVVELTADKLVLFNSDVSAGTGWLWTFVPL